MTIEKMNKEIEKKRKELSNKYESMKKKIETGTSDINPKLSVYGLWYLKRCTNESEDIQESSYEDVVSEYNDLAEETKNDKHKPGFKITLKAESFYDDNEATAKWEADWVDIIAESSLENVIKRELRIYIGKLINPKKDGMDHEVECKNLEMFLSEELTYKGLVNCTYGTCEV